MLLTISCHSYYTTRDKEVSRRGVNNSNILAEIPEARYKKNETACEGSKRHCESTKVSDKKHLLGQNLQMDDEQRILHRNLIMKHAAIFNNGSQTARNHDNRDERIFNQTSSDNEGGKRSHDLTIFL